MKLLWQTGCERSGNKASVSHYIVAAMAALGHYQSPFFPSLLSLERTVVSRGFAARRLLNPMCAADHRRRKRLLALFGSISWKLRREELIREAWVITREPLAWASQSRSISTISRAYLLTHARYPHPSSSNGPLCSQGIVQDYSCRGGGGGGRGWGYYTHTIRRLSRASYWRPTADCLGFLFPLSQ